MFRLLRTNLNYLVRGKKEQTILVTSSMAGDGKTFIAVNLGISLALANKKVILLGMDLRKPKLSKYLLNISDAEGVGLTNYLVEDVAIDRIINPTEIHSQLYLIPSGPIPPNPAELLGSVKTQQLFAELRKQFDYIIIDTAPVGLVADAFLLTPYTNTTLFAIRYAKTSQEALKDLEQMRQNGKLNNPAVVLNGVKKGKGYGYGYGYGNKYGYGYGYGYYEDDKQKNWFWRIFS
jgi:capsular exopolysaccharide synthesis family protein